jgi:hypothetical protein
MTRKKHSDGVPNVIFDSDAALRLRRRCMRTSYVLRDVTESVPNVSFELNNSIRVLNFTRCDNDITEGIVSHTTDEDNSSFTDDLSDSGPLIYIPSLNVMDEEDAMIDEYPKHDMPGEFHVSLSHNLLDVTTGDIKQFIAIHPLKQMLLFQENVAIESGGETLEDSDEWVLSEDSDGLNSSDDEANDSSLDFD